MYIAGHTNIKANNMSDEFAKHGVDMRLIGPKLFFGSRRNFGTRKQKK